MSPSMANGSWERPRALLLLSLAWLAAGQEGGERGAVGAPCARRSRAPCRVASGPGGLPAFIAGRPETSRCFSRWLVIQAVGKMG